MNDATRIRLTRQDLHDAVVEGALLRLRPKVMTVSTVVAGLLPIMWSQRVGADVMKPLATPVLGGMVSSLAYVLIVTPVLFLWIQERRLQPVEGVIDEALPVPRRWVPVAASIVVLLALAGGGWWVRDRLSATPRAEDAAPTGSVLQTVHAGDLNITLSNPGGELRTGANAFRIEFRSARTNSLVDVGTVTLNAAMNMPGMAMAGDTRVTPAAQRGVYDVAGDFSMSGAWQMTLEWNGPAGRGSANFNGSVQ